MGVPFYQLLFTERIWHMKKLDITIIGERGKFDWVSFLAGLVHVGEKRITSISDLATQLIKLCANGDTIVRLQLIDHGNTTGQYIGDDWLSVDTFAKYRDNLARFRSCFGKDAIVTMGGCKVGYATKLLSQLSSLWGGVTVRAGTAYQRPLLPGIEGGVESCVMQTCSYSGKNYWDKLDGN
jgi:hypothetical protein